MAIKYSKNDIAIIGYSYKFPNVEDDKSYWELLYNNNEGINDLHDSEDQNKQN